MGMFLRRGTAPHRTRMSDLEVGSSIKLNLNGTPWKWLVVHQGLPSDMYDESCDGTWLLLKDMYESRQWNSSNVNKLESSTIHSYLNGDFQNLLDTNIKDAIKQVKIPYRAGGGRDGTDQIGANGLSTKVFLLSGYEVGWTTSDNQYFPVDGAKLSYFESGAGTSASNKRIAYLNGSDVNWWLRSPYTNRTNYVWYVRADGVYNDYYATISRGIRPAIILDPDFIVTDDMLA
mgnify:CR=1 FL=1